MPTLPSSKPVTVADWLAQPEDARLELIDGVLLPKAAPTFEHGRAQVGTSIAVSRAGPVARTARAAGGSRARSTSSSTAAGIVRTSSAGVATSFPSCPATAR
jgi:Uma2 family endonuclease